jgi:hypothetical protein
MLHWSFRGLRLGWCVAVARHVASCVASFRNIFAARVKAAAENAAVRITGLKVAILIWHTPSQALQLKSLRLNPK